MLVLKTKYQKLCRVVFSPDGRGLAAAGQKGAFWWRSVFDDPKPERIEGHECPGVGFAAGGEHLFAVLNIQTSWKTVLAAIALADGARRDVTLSDRWATVSACPATGLAVVESWASNEMSGWGVGPDGAPACRWNAPVRLGCIGAAVMFGPGGDWFVRLARSSAGLLGALEFVVHDAADGKELRAVLADEGTICPPALSPDGERIVFGSGHVLRVQALNGTARVPPLRNDNTHQFTDFAFHPSGRFVAATNNDATVKLYDAVTWEVARTFTWNIGRMRSIAFSPDGTLAAAGSDTGKVVIWDLDL